MFFALLDTRYAARDIASAYMKELRIGDVYPIRYEVDEPYDQPHLQEHIRILAPAWKDPQRALSRIAYREFVSQLKL